MKRKKLTFLIAGLVIVLVAFAFLQLRPRTEQVSTRPTELRTMNASRGSLVNTISTSGSISGAKQISLGFPQAGQVKTVFIEKGDYVEAGTVLAQMDNSQQELALMKAKNAVEIAKIDSSIANQKEKELDLQIAITNLAKTQIIAPFSGLIVDMDIEVGESIAANTSAITLLDNSQYFVHVTVDELDMKVVNLGQNASVTVDALGGKTFKGVISDIGWLAQFSGGLVTVPVTIRLTETSGELKIGYSAAVLIETARVDEALKLPLEAVIRQGNRSMVTVLRNGTEEAIWVETGLTDGREVEIVSGLNPDDQVVILNYRGFNPTTNIGGNTPGHNMNSLQQQLGRFGR